MQVSLQRVNEFLEADESQPNVIYRQGEDEIDGQEEGKLVDEGQKTAIRINGSFSFGLGASDSQDAKKKEDKDEIKPAKKAADKKES